MTSSSTPKHAILASAFAAIVLASGAGALAADNLNKITFQLNYPAAGYNAGYELAVVKGFYKDAGLDVTIEPGNGSQITAQLVASGKANIAFADSAPVMKLDIAGRQDQGAGDDPSGQSESGHGAQEDSASSRSRT